MKNIGQVTVFIITALLIVALIVFFFIFKDNLKINSKVNPNVEEVYSFVKQCIKDVGTDAVYNIGQKGGYFIPPKLSTEGGIPYYSINNISYVPKKEKIENEISKYILENLPFCINNFSNMTNFQIKQGEIKPTVKIKDDKVILNVNYSLTIYKNKNKYRIVYFRDIPIDVRFGLVYDFSKTIIQNYIEYDSVCISCLLKIQKDSGLELSMKQKGNITIYEIEDLNSLLEDKGGVFGQEPYNFRFAIRI